MKKIMLILIVGFVYLNIVSLYSQSGWIDKGKYKQNSITTSSISKIELKNNDTILSFCKDSNYYSFLLFNGNKIAQSKYSNNGKIYIEDSSAYFKGEIIKDKSKYPYPTSAYISCYNSKNDSLLWQNPQTKADQNPESNALILLNSKKNIIGNTYYVREGAIESWESGVVDLLNINNKILTNLEPNGYLNSIGTNDKETEFLISTFTTYSFYHMGTTTYGIKYKNHFIDSNFKHYELLNIDSRYIYFGFSNFQFSPDGNYFLAYVNSQILIWNKKSMKAKYIIDLPKIKEINNSYSNIVFTNDSKKILLNYNEFDLNGKLINSSLQIRGFSGNLIKDSLFYQSKINNNIVLIKNTNKFLIGGDEGVIRLFEDELLNKGIIADFKKDLLTNYANQEIQFIDYSFSNIISWNWDFGDGSTSTKQNPIHIYKKSGDYSVKLIVFDGKLYDTLLKRNYIQLRVKAGFETANIKVIAPYKVDFVNNSKGDNKTFKWYFGDGDSSNDPVPSHIYTKAGLYDVKLIVSDGTYSDTLFKKAYIKVVLPLQAGFEISNNIGITPFKVDFKNVSTGEITSYKWYFGDGDSSIIASPSHTYTKGGNFTVSLIVSDGINSSTYTKEKFISVSDNLSVEGGPAKEEIPPFSPNPVKDKLFIQISEFNNTDKIQIIDLNGRKLIESELKETIDVSSLSKGIYFLKIGNRQWKFVKE